MVVTKYFVYNSFAYENKVHKDFNNRNFCTTTSKHENWLEN